MCPRLPSRLPKPVLTLRLPSGSSSLHGFITEDSDDAPTASNSAIPPSYAYSMQTFGPKTTISRCDPFQAGMRDIAAIQWPTATSVKGKQRIEVTVDGWFGVAEDLLKKCLLSSDRKFRIPGYPQTLKWKKAGSRYECVTCSKACTSHLAVAIYEPAGATLELFVGSLLEDGPSQSISTILVDHILVTALVMATCPQDWRKQHSQSQPNSPKKGCWGVGSMHAPTYQPPPEIYTSYFPRSDDGHSSYAPSIMSRSASLYSASRSPSPHDLIGMGYVPSRTPSPRHSRTPSPYQSRAPSPYNTLSLPAPHHSRSLSMPQSLSRNSSLYTSYPHSPSPSLRQLAVPPSHLPPAYEAEIPPQYKDEWSQRRPLADRHTA